jgi:hypothetical protein
LPADSEAPERRRPEGGGQAGPGAATIVLVVCAVVSTLITGHTGLLRPYLASRQKRSKPPLVPVLAWRIREAEVPKLPGSPKLVSVLSFWLVNHGKPLEGACWSFPGITPYAGRITKGSSHDEVVFAAQKANRDRFESMKLGDLELKPEPEDIVLGCRHLQTGAQIHGLLWYTRPLGESGIRQPRTRSDTLCDWPVFRNRGEPQHERPPTAFAVDRVLYAALVSVFGFFVVGACLLFGTRV